MKAETHLVRVAHHTTTDEYLLRIDLTVADVGSVTHRETIAEVSQNFNQPSSLSRKTASRGSARSNSPTVFLSLDPFTSRD
jgi:hypothetical protein